MIGRAIPTDDSEPRHPATADAGPPRKRIALFADGTGNSARKPEKTNVWRLFQALDQTDPDQIAFYDDGVGTSSNKYLAAVGLAFGWGLKRNVVELYKFVCRNYDPAGTDIYGFGFSRGAFTIRVLIGMIDTEGLVTYRSREELDRNAAAAYRHYRAKGFPSRSPIVIGMRRLRDLLIMAKDRIKGYRPYAEVARDTEAAGRTGVPIRFLGLWDTVEAYGMPIEELKRGIDWVLWPMMFGNTVLSQCVQRACHALSLDDERKTFHPLLWDEGAEARMVAEGKVAPGRITQVWFAGVHSNLGGGYPEDQLSLVSLEWMMTEAVANDLTLEKDAIEQAAAVQSPYARLYDSRRGFAAYYRYAPRRIPLWNLDTPAPILPIVHGSVILRMAFGSDSYAPISLPFQFWVLAPDGELMPMEGFERLRLDATKKYAAGARLMKDDDSAVVAAKARLVKAVGSLARPNHEAVSLVWDTVFWRRALYFLTVVLTAILVLYPWLGGLLSRSIGWLLSWIPFVGEHLADQYGRMVARTDGYAYGPLSNLADMLSGFIPSYASPYTNALTRHPAEFGALAVGVLVALAGSRILQSRICDRALLAWHPDEARRKNYVAWLRESRVGWRNGMLAALIAAALAFVISVATSGLKTERSLELGALVGLFGGLWAWRSGAVAKAAKEPPDQIGETVALRLARRLRRNAALNRIAQTVFQKAVPIAFALVLVALGFYLANRVAFDAASALGGYCRSTLGEDAFASEKLGAADVATTSLCNPTGLVLREGHRYRVTLTTPGDWFDRTGRADVAGFGADSFAHFSATLMKRWWFEGYFKPIVRIGRFGNDEYVLTPAEPFDDHVYCRDPKKNGGLPAAAKIRDIEACLRTPPRRPDMTPVQIACGCCPQAEEKINPLTGQIDRGSADLMLACSPTPPGRRSVSTEITARRSGELFVSVNDAVLPLLGAGGYFYGNNSGTAVVKVERPAR